MSEEKKYKWIASITVCIFFFCKYLEKGEKRASSKSYVNQVHAEQYFEIKRRIIPNYPTFRGKTLKLQLCILFEIL